MADDEHTEPPRKKTSRPPILAVAVVLGSVYLLWALREETVYFFRSRTPQELSVAKLTSDGHNTFARVQGVPDRARTVIMDGRWGRHRAFFRVLGARSRLFVAQTRKHRMAPESFTDVFQGRLLRMADQAYFPQLYKYLVDHMTTVAGVPTEELLKNVGKAVVELRDRTGEPLRITAKDELFISIGFPGEYRVQFDREKYPNERETDTMMAGLGLDWGPLEDSRAFRAYVAHADEGQASALMERFRDVKLKVGVVPRTAAVRCAWGEVKNAEGKLVVRALDDAIPTPFTLADDGLLRPAAPPAPIALDPSHIRSVEAQIPFRVPREAMVLIDGDEPAAFWYIAAADVLLLLLVTVNVLVLLRIRIRGRAGAIE